MKTQTVTRRYFERTKLRNMCKKKYNKPKPDNGKSGEKKEGNDPGDQPEEDNFRVRVRLPIASHEANACLTPSQFKSAGDTWFIEYPDDKEPLTEVRAAASLPGRANASVVGRVAGM